ncbi:MAG: hypothetical protein QNJ37_20755 [Crocosphaera sp.]|nr:hypothetical protein [Crocosphaera sp.]
MAWTQNLLYGLAGIGLIAIGTAIGSFTSQQQPPQNPLPTSLPPIVSGETSPNAVEFRLLILDKFNDETLDRVDYIILAGNKKFEGQSGSDGFIILDLDQIDVDEIQVTLKRNQYQQIERETIDLTGNANRVKILHMEQLAINSEANCETTPPDTQLETDESIVREGAAIFIRYRNACPQKTFITIATQNSGFGLNTGLRRKAQTADQYEGTLQFDGLLAGKYEARSYYGFANGETPTGSVRFEVVAP